MKTKYLIAILYLIVSIQTAQVSVDDIQEFSKSTFYNLIKVPNVAIG
jgi:hypothetical protein